MFKYDKKNWIQAEQLKHEQAFKLGLIALKGLRFQLEELHKLAAARRKLYEESAAEVTLTQTQIASLEQAMSEWPRDWAVTSMLLPLADSKLGTTSRKSLASLQLETTLNAYFSKPTVISRMIRKLLALLRIVR